MKNVNRKNSYISFLEKYPLCSTLMVLKEYEGKELYEECAVIKNALEEYRDRYIEELPKNVVFPLHLSVYKSKKYQDKMKELDIEIKQDVLEDKANLIKLHLPI